MNRSSTRDDMRNNPERIFQNRPSGRRSKEEQHLKEDVGRLGIHWWRRVTQDRRDQGAYCEGSLGPSCQGSAQEDDYDDNSLIYSEPTS